MGRPKSDEPRTRNIAVWVTPAEHEILKTKAYATALPLSMYLRNLGMNYRIKSRVDFRAVDELVQTKNGLGRIGGLFKLWIVQNKDKESHLGSRSFQEIEHIVDEIEKKEDEIIKIAAMLMNQCNQKITRKV